MAITESDAKLEDERFGGESIEIRFAGNLRADQKAAVAKMLLIDDIGVLCAPTGFGKTVVAAAIAANSRCEYINTRSPHRVAPTMEGTSTGSFLMWTANSSAP